MEVQYTFTGRGGEIHKLVQTQTKNTYQVVTNYPIGTTGRLNKKFKEDINCITY